MALINLFSENIILPLGDFFTGQSVARHFNFLQKSQWWTKEQLISFQEERLRKLISHSVSSVPYYRDLFIKYNLRTEDIKTIEDLKKVPILTKDIIRKEGLERFISTTVPAKKKFKSSSSGSTGEPLSFYETFDSNSFDIAANLRGWYWMGYRLGDRFIKISNSPRSRLKQLQDLLSRNKCIYFHKTDDKSIIEIIKKINEYKPMVIRAYNAPVAVIMLTANKHGLTFF
jgi:phenylacetate-CoA ligase